MRLKGWRFFKEKEAARDRVAVRRCEKLAQPVSRDAMCATRAPRRQSQPCCQAPGLRLANKERNLSCGLAEMFVGL
jgi:hypothetical protein